MHESGHGRNRDQDFANRKKGGNKGIAAAKKDLKRHEAETRNAKTLPHKRRAARRET